MSGSTGGRGPARAALVAAGGAAGATARWAVGEALPDPATTGLPWALLLVNLVGALVLAAVLVEARRRPLHPGWITGVGAGFCGGLTTFSGIAVVTAAQLRAGHPAWAAATLVTVLASTVGGVAAVRITAARAAR